MEKNSFIEKTYVVGTHWNCLYKDICCRYTLKLPHRGNSNVYLQHMLLKIRKKIILEIYIFQVSCPLSLHILSIQNCQINQYLNSCHSTAFGLSLHDSYISKFEFMNFLFTNLLDVWLQVLPRLKKMATK